MDCFGIQHFFRVVVACDALSTTVFNKYFLFLAFIWLVCYWVDKNVYDKINKKSYDGYKTSCNNVDKRATMKISYWILVFGFNVFDEPSEPLFWYRSLNLIFFFWQSASNLRTNYVKLNENTKIDLVYFQSFYFPLKPRYTYTLAML